MSHDIEQHTPSPSPTRRTVLTGAAWSVPVIAAASLAPFAAASGTPVLAFNQASYSGTACGTITGASVSVTTNGTATAGVSVTTTLSGGYTFAGGSASYTGVSDGSGKVALPAINVPSVGGSGTASAVSGAASAGSSLTAPAQENVVWQQPNGTQTTYAFPAGTKSVGDQTYLTPTGELYLGQSALIASDVTSASAQASPGVGWYITYVRSDGTAGWREPDGTVHSYTFPAGTKTVGDVNYLTPSGELYFGQSTLIASNVTSASAQAAPTLGWYITWVRSDGTAGWQQPNGTVQTFTFPAGTKTVGDQTYLTPTGNLYLGQSALIASTVTSASAQAAPGLGWYITWVRSDGTAGWQHPGGAQNNTFPAGTKTVGDQTYLTPTGDLYLGQSALIASNVTSASAQAAPNLGWYINAVRNPTC
ncbi:hypothetical protein [Microbacterium sp. RURRCA19A]|uniref:hypothetical protein n=1 Tax=Microbacterium sp. RURRCA19A TaxID=1907391 RepID=UPI001115790B|nr:hypothetical protein [Microbacterium sp. RURRCA19A]